MYCVVLYAHFIVSLIELNHKCNMKPDQPKVVFYLMKVSRCPLFPSVKVVSKKLCNYVNIQVKYNYTSNDKRKSRWNFTIIKL